MRQVDSLSEMEFSKKCTDLSEIGQVKCVIAWTDLFCMHQDDSFVSYT